MYLVHVQLVAPAGRALPEETARIVTESAEESDGLEHVSIHGQLSSEASTSGGGQPVIGIFLVSASLPAAERCAWQIVRRAVAAHPALRGFEVDGAEAVLTPLLWNVLEGPV